MTDQVKEAVARLTRTIREIQESSGPPVVRRQEGDFYTFSTPGFPRPPAGAPGTPEDPKREKATGRVLEGRVWDEMPLDAHDRHAAL
jgi:hypothetical protein